MASRVPGGFILLARKIQESEIWRKPSWWFKVWIYILLKVNHKDGGGCRRGEGFFSYRQIYHECNLLDEGIHTNSLKVPIKWMKQSLQISTRKSTRGFYVKVLNYELYQDIDSYRIPTEIPTRIHSQSPQNPYRIPTINKNGNKRKNEYAGKVEQ